MKLQPNPSENGSAMIEFAVSTIVFFMLMLGCIGIAMAFYSYEVVNEYARDASRYAIVHGNGCSYLGADGKTIESCSIGAGDTTGPPPTVGPADAALLAYINNEIYPGIHAGSLSVATTYTHAPGLTSCFATNCNGGGDQVTVTVSYPYLYAIPFIPQRSFTMNATSTMIISQ